MRGGSISAFFLHNEFGYVSMRAVMRTIALILVVGLCASAVAGLAADKGLTVKGVRYFSYAGFTRIVFETDEAKPYVLTRSEDRRSLYFSSYGVPFMVTALALPSVNDGVIKALEARQDGSQKGISILLGPEAGEVKDFVLRSPDRIVVDVFRGSPIPATPPVQASTVIVIDPGHGGSDTGIVSNQGVEKTLTLELANALRKALRKSATKYAILLTREQDQTLTLDERAAAANAAGASLFVSIHMSAGKDQHVFLLDPDEGRSLPSPGRQGDFLGFDALSEHQQALWGTQQAGHSQDSNRLGRTLARALSGRNDAEPVQAPFVLLEPVAAAAVLVEVNAGQNRTQVADALARGIDQYVREKR
jgi:N-acetylmuramoyl-L-alanine amidase